MRRARLALVLGLLMAAAVVAVALAFERDEPLGPPIRAAATGEWRPLAPAGLERTEVAAARIGRSIYVVGGFEKRSGLTTGALERYDIRANRWRRLRSMPGRPEPSDGRRLSREALRARGVHRAARPLERHARGCSPTTRARTAGRGCRSPPGRGRPTGSPVIGRRLFAFGGRNAGGAMRSMEVYDFKRRRWRAGPPMKGPRRDHMTGVAAGGFIYALAGPRPRQLRRRPSDTTPPGAAGRRCRRCARRAAASRRRD